LRVSDHERLITLSAAAAAIAGLDYGETLGQLTKFNLAHYDGGLQVPQTPHDRGTLTLGGSHFELRFKGNKGWVYRSLSEFTFEAEDLDDGGCEVTVRQTTDPSVVGVFDVTNASADAFLGEIALHEEERDAAAQRPVANLGSDDRYAINPLGLGLVLLGAAVAILGTFLPRAETTAFTLAGIDKNTLLQNGDGAVIIIGAVILGADAYNGWAAGARRTVAICLVSACLIGLASYEGTGSRIALYRINADGSQGAQVDASAGIGIYAVGVGGLLGILGGWVIRRSSPLATDDGGEPTGPEPTKRCPDCAEEVLAAARVCKHCGYRFPAPQSAEYAQRCHACNAQNMVRSPDNLCHACGEPVGGAAPSRSS
jgi:hypothetical protein